MGKEKEMKTMKVLATVFAVWASIPVLGQAPSMGINPKMELQLFGHSNNYYQLESSVNPATGWTPFGVSLAVADIPHIQPIGIISNSQQFFRAKALVGVYNGSYSDLCAEHDNINVAFTGDVTNFSIIATHPTYQVTDYTGLPDFSNCPIETNVNYSFNAYSQTINYGSYSGSGYAVVQRDASWWEPQGMIFTLNGSSQIPNVHHIQIGKQIPGTSEWPEYFVLYCDGNTRLIPFPPAGQGSVCFGSSVIIGPAPMATRPCADIASVDFQSYSNKLFVTYRSGGTATIFLSSVTRTNAIVKVNVNYPTDKPFCTFRSMFVSYGNSDCDQVLWKGIDGATNIDSAMSLSGTTGTEWFFTRQTKSKHNQSAPDIRILFQ